MKNKFGIFIFSFFYVIVQFWCTSITFKYPYNGIYVEQNRQNEWIISALDKNSASSKLDIKVGDVVKKIDDHMPDEFPNVKKWRAIEQAHSILITRSGHEQEILINIRSTVIYDIIPLLEELLCLFMAVLLFGKMPHYPSAKLLSFVFLNGGIIYMSRGVSIRGDVIGKLLITSFMMILPIAFYHFLVVFFKEKSRIDLPKWILKYLYSIATIAILIRLLIFYPPLSYPIFRFNATVTLCFFIIGFIINIFVLSALYYKVRKEKSYLSSLTKMIWFSVFVSFLPIICFSFIPQIIHGQQIVDAVYTSWFILLFPITFAYLIATNQLYDIGHVVLRFLFAIIIAIVPAGILTGIYKVIFYHIVDVKQILFIFIGSVVTISLVLYSTEYFTTRLESILFPRKFMLRSALKKIAKNLGAISSFRELKEIILVDIVKTLEVKGGAIVFKFKDDTEIIYDGDINSNEIVQLIDEPDMHNHQEYTCIEINRHEEYHSYLIMTRKKTNTLLGKEEIQWLNLITSYLEVSLENVHLIRKLTTRLQQLAAQFSNEQTAKDFQWFRKIMFELQEEERMRIAADLHDTTMQDLFFLKRKFTTLAEKYAANNEDQEQLNHIIKFVDLINSSLRQSCFELNPHLLKEIGLIQTVLNYLEKEAYHTPFHIEFDPDGSTYRIEKRDLTTKRHIFRMVQELLNNAKKHSHAKKVSFRMTVRDSLFYLFYEDDGVGFNDKQVSQVEIGSSGLGLDQMRGRVLHLAGQMEIETRGKRGVRLSITIPIKEGMIN